MRYARVPKDVTLVDLITKKSGESVSFFQYACFCWLDDPKWLTPKTNLARLQKILPEFQKPPGEWMQLEDADYKVLKEIVESPGRTYNPLVHIQLSPAFDAPILGALTEDAYAIQEKAS
jgi:hypothetical protein